MARAMKVAIVDDEADMRASISQWLALSGFDTETYSSAEEALKALGPEFPGVVVSDIKMPGMDGMAFLKRLMGMDSGLPVILITGHGDVPMAVEAMRVGAYDFLEKPVQPDMLLGLVRRTLNARKMVIENMRLRRRVARYGDLRGRLIGTSAAIRECRRQLLEIAPLPITILLHGEAGTGKEVTARAIHDFSEVAGEFHPINCANLDDATLRAELRAIPDQDTVHFRALHRLGATGQSIVAEYLRQPRRARVLVSVTGDPAKCHASGQITDELYYLVAVAPIRLPPLREREKDVFTLLELFLRDAAGRFGKPLPPVTRETLVSFRKYPWPGNLRQLRGVAERMVLGLPLGLDHVPAGDGAPVASYDEAMQSHERAILERALMEAGGQKGAAADLLQIPRKRLYLRMKATGLLE